MGPRLRGDDGKEYGSDLGVLVTGSLAERGLRGGEAGDRHAEGRARDIIEADLVTKRD